MLTGDGTRRFQRSRAYTILTILILLSLLAPAPAPASAVATSSVARPSAASVSTEPASPDVTPGVAPGDPVNVHLKRPLTAPVTVSRSEFSRVEMNPDGTGTAIFSERPMHWLDKQAGRWTEFDNKLRPVPAAEGLADFGVENTANGFKARFGKAGSLAVGKPALVLSDEHGSVSMTLRGARPKDAVVSGSKITYTDAFENTAVSYQVDNERVKEDITLARPPVGENPLSYVFDLDLEGVSPTLLPDNSVAFRDAAGKTVFEMPRPYLLDSNTNPSEGPQFSNAVRVTLTKVGNKKARLELAPDMEWLRDPARVYPVVLDPTLKGVTLTPDGSYGRNATIYEENPDYNDYGNYSMYVGKRSSDGKRRDGLIKFITLDSMPADSAIISATMDLHVETSAADMQINVQRNTTVWEPSTVTWNNQPGTTSYVWDTVAPGLNTASFDLTALMREWVKGSYPRQGVRLVSAAANGKYTYFSSSFDLDEIERPLLRVRFMTASRYGVNKLWTYSSQDHGGGNVSRVNLSTGNVVLHHAGGSIPTRGFNVDLTHTYNSQDDYGLNSGYIGSRGGAVYGEQWSFSQSVRLYEVDTGNAVVFKDGSGGANRVYLKNADANGVRSYIRPIHYGSTLTKDVSTPQADKVWTLKTDPGRSTQYFDAEGKRTSIDDGKGNKLTFTYDASDRLATITDVATPTRTTTFTYAGTGGRLSQITDMAGRNHTYTYDTNGNLLTITHAAGTADAVTTTFGYDATNQLVSVKNPRNHTSYIRYDSLYSWNTAGSVDGWIAIGPGATIAQSTEHYYSGVGSLKVNLSGFSPGEIAGARMDYSPPKPLNSVPQELITWVYVPAGAPQMEGRLYLRHNNSYNSSNAFVTLAAGWNALRFEAALMDPALDIDQIEVNLRPLAGQPTYTGAVWIDHMFVKGTVESVTDAKNPVNTIARYGYNFNEGWTAVKRPDDGGVERETRFDYSRDGQVLLVTDPLGNITTAAYDQFLNLVSITPAGEAPGTSSTTSYQYSYYPNSNQLQSFQNEALETQSQGMDPVTGDTKYSIDARNDYRRTHNQTYVATIYKRDVNGNVLEAQTNRYAAGVDLEVNHLATPQATLRMTKFTYGAGGLVTSMTPPECVGEPDTTVCRTTFTYDGENRGYLTSISMPAGTGEGSRRVVNITPNDDSTTQYAVDPKGQKTTFSYDQLMRLTQINYGMQDGVADFSNVYTLDDNGNITALSDDNGSGSWAYDANNRPTSQSRRQNGATKSVTYSYYPNGLPSSMGGYGGTTSFGYDNGLRLSTQTDPLDGGRTIRYGYDSRNRRTSVTFPSGVKQRATYDVAGRLQLLKLLSGGTGQTEPSTLQSFDYDYGSTSAGTFWNGYVRSAIETVSGLSNATTSYNYDDMNRLTSATRTGLSPFTQSYTYDLNNNRTRLVDDGVTTNATYDFANQMTSLGSVAYTYDRNGNLVDYGSNSLTYDAANHQTSGVVNGSNLSFGYDGFGRRVSRTDDGLRTDYWYDTTGLSLETDTSGNRTNLLRDPGGNLRTIERITPTQQGSPVYNYGVDRLGSTTALTSTSGSLVNTYRYDPWGQPNGGTGTAYNPFRYTGTYLDTMTGTYQMGARYYQPGSGRFTQLDPLPKSVLTANRYAYTNCNPANATDPTGLITYECGQFLADFVALSATIIAGQFGSWFVEKITDIVVGQLYSSGSFAIEAAFSDGVSPLDALMTVVDNAMTLVGWIPVVGNWIAGLWDLGSTLWSLTECVNSYAEPA